MSSDSSFTQYEDFLAKKDVVDIWGILAEVNFAIHADVRDELEPMVDFLKLQAFVITGVLEMQIITNELKKSQNSTS